jgi:hypothetical protein
MLMAITAARNAETLGDPKSAEDFVRQAGLIMEAFGVTPGEEETASGLLDIVRDLRGLFDRQKEEEASRLGGLSSQRSFSEGSYKSRRTKKLDKLPSFLGRGDRKRIRRAAKQEAALEARVYDGRHPHTMSIRVRGGLDPLELPPEIL